MSPRRALQAGALALAGVLVLHGFLGPDFAPRNLATLTVWVHTRGFLVLALLAFGNAFCMACPFTLVRDWARRLTRPVRRWPRAWRTKAPALALFVGILFSYERWGLWGAPAATAGLILAYFALAVIVDASFTGAPFCKWLCPLGQFNFAASALSPFEVAAKDLSVCASCRTKDCLRGNAGQRGCELGLFLPRKAGSMDCTFCLDCVAACPAGNAGLALRLPGAELFDGRWRSGVGLPSRRPDLGALSALFFFGALLNAFAMTAPAAAAAESLSSATGLRGATPVLAMMFVLGLAVLPSLLLFGTALLSRREGTLGEVILSAAPCLVPLGMGVWGAHYGFHLLTGLGTIVPAAQSAAESLFGAAVLGRPLWGLGGMSPASAQAVGQGLLTLGLAGSLAVARKLGDRSVRSWPWLVLCAGLWVVAVWVLSQPMPMRGVMPA